MSISADGWLDWATRRPGPVNKVYPTRNLGQGIVFHSMEGWMAGSMGELDNPLRQASWMFSTGLDGILYQHYPITASCWASGNSVANTRYWSHELEGLQGSPANAAQEATVLRLIREWEGHSGQQAKRQANIWEHREVWNLSSPNAGPTACPSERYAGVWAKLAPEEDEMGMTPAEAQQLADTRALVQTLIMLTVGNGTIPGFSADPRGRLMELAGPPNDLNLYLYVDALNAELTKVKAHLGLA